MCEPSPVIISSAPPNTIRHMKVGGVQSIRTTPPTGLSGGWGCRDVVWYMYCEGNKRKVRLGV